jgi:hypothetical protein
LFVLLGLDDDFAGADERIGESIHADFIGRDVDGLPVPNSALISAPILIGRPLPPTAVLSRRRSGANAWINALKFSVPALFALRRPRRSGRNI